jgi:hypothetical protein
MPIVTGRYYWETITKRILGLTIGEKSHILIISFQHDTSPEMIEDFLSGARMNIINQRGELYYTGALLRFEKRQHLVYKIILELEITTKNEGRVISKTRTILEDGFKISFFPLFGSTRNKISFTIQSQTKRTKKAR